MERCSQPIEEQLVTLANEVAHLRKLNNDLDAENDQLRARNLYLEKYAAKNEKLLVEIEGLKKALAAARSNHFLQPARH